MIRHGLVVALVASSFGCSSARETERRHLPALPPVAANQLRAVSDFAAIANEKDRSRALFLEEFTRADDFRHDKTSRSRSSPFQRLTGGSNPQSFTSCVAALTT